MMQRPTYSMLKTVYTRLLVRRSHSLCTRCIGLRRDVRVAFRTSGARLCHSEAGANVPSRETEGCKDEEGQPKQTFHVPVMKTEVLNLFMENNCTTILDMTFGAGGHTKALLDAIPQCKVIALDRDPVAVSMAMELAETRPESLTVFNGRFSDVPKLLQEAGIKRGDVDGMLMDLGSSSMQFDEAARGFSVSKDGPLDMRMDGDRLSTQPTAADVVNSLDETDLGKIIKRYGEDRNAKKIAHGIVQARSAFGRISTTKQLASVVENIFPGYYGVDKLGRYSHPATKVFQALRIFVNNELNELNAALEVAHEYLAIGGMCVAISFHSLEDRIVKRHFHDIDMEAEKNQTLHQKLRSSTSIFTQDELEILTQKKWKPVSRKILVPTTEEVTANPRSRSAKLRAARKI